MMVMTRGNAASQDTDTMSTTDREILENAVALLGDDPRLSVYSDTFAHFGPGEATGFAEAFTIPGGMVMIVDENGEQTPVPGQIFAATGRLKVWVELSGEVRKETNIRRIQRNPDDGLCALYIDGELTTRAPVYGGEIRRVKRMDLPMNQEVTN